jgi:HK97 family phage portal protein
MATLLQTVSRWFGWGGALSESGGEQYGLPATTLTEGVANIGPDGALQLDAVWACIELRANTIASLPYFAYESKNGEKTLARDSRLYTLLHETPNSRMTPFEFWRAMMMNHDLRGNAYARLERIAGEVVSMWPMPADQVRPFVLDDGSMAYEYTIDGDIAVLAASNVLHLKNLGNGTVGLAKLEFMRSTTDEQAKAQSAASKVFGNGGKPTAILMIDSALTPAQREGLRANYGELSSGSMSRLAVLEANMKYQQLSLSPEDQQLLETRRFGVEQICRWFGVPAVLVNHPGVVQYGNHDIVEGFFYKLTIRPMVVNIEQAVRKRIMTPKQRASMSAEFSMDALLRGSAKERAELHATYVQNGIVTRAEVRQVEGWPYIEGTDTLTAQSNLLPLDKLGQEQPKGGINASAQDSIAQ